MDSIVAHFTGWSNLNAFGRIKLMDSSLSVITLPTRDNACWDGGVAAKAGSVVTRFVSPSSRLNLLAIDSVKRSMWERETRAMDCFWAQRQWRRADLKRARQKTREQWEKRHTKQNKHATNTKETLIFIARYHAWSGIHEKLTRNRESWPWSEKTKLSPGEKEGSQDERKNPKPIFDT